MIRFLEDREKLNIIPLYEETFDDEKAFREYFYNEIVPISHIAADVEKNEIRSMLSLIPKSVTIGRSREHCFYVYGVATKKECRKKGLMCSLFDEVLNGLYKAEECFTYLVPSSADNAGIYKKLGFEYVMDKSSVKKEEVRKKPTHSLILRKADYSDLERLSIFARSMTNSRYGVFLTKDKEYFKNMFSLMNAEGGKIELYFENRIVLGYRVVFEDEIIEEVLDDTISELSLIDDAMSKPYAMARLLNIEKTLKMLGTKETGNVVVKVKDSVIKDNDGTFLWRFGNNLQSFEKMNLKPEVEVTIGQLTAHVFGYRQIKGLPIMNAGKGFFINDYV